jgi:hypothetical protein
MNIEIPISNKLVQEGENRHSCGSTVHPVGFPSSSVKEKASMMNMPKVTNDFAELIVLRAKVVE